MDIKFFMMCVSVAVGTLSYLVYIQRLFVGGNMPHPFSWFVWSLTSGTIASAMVFGGAGFGAVPYLVNASLVVIIFLASIPRGSREIAVPDVIFLAAALLAILGWWFMGDPLIAVFLITGIDLFGYFPTYRKIITLPRSESLIAWFGFLIGTVFAILAQENYSITTLTYPVMITAATVVLIFLLLVGRRRMPASAE